MNKIVNNLAQIADAAEYFDRKTGAAWKIRGALTNMLVWSANGLLYANQTNDPERIFKARTELATLRIWARDANTSSFVLDLTPSNVRRTLGLERQVDVHEEAVRMARMKCIQIRSTSRFQQFYKDAVSSIAISSSAPTKATVAGQSPTLYASPPTAPATDPPA